MATSGLKAIKGKVLYVATHYTWAFVIVMTITVISCGFSIHYLATLESELRDVYENDVRGGDAVQSAYVALLGVESSAKDLVLFSDPGARERTKATLRDDVSAVKSALNRAFPRFYTPKARQAMENALRDLKTVITVLDDTMAWPDSHKAMTADDLAPLQGQLKVLERDFNLLLANRTANSHIGVTQLIGELRLSLICTVGLVVVTVVIRLVMYVAGHPSRKKGQQPVNRS